eukprot:Phypoly_transcript_19272.p1 GENE.Phypoly_transcript_19272~~Phypoly_transcript_19272.p1  ORF type:complete len:143 (+),score=5.48 Phypoly_transcript_19272:76-504(+)
MGTSPTKQIQTSTKMNCKSNSDEALQFKGELDTIINHIEAFKDYPAHGRGMVGHNRGCKSLVRGYSGDNALERKEFIDYTLLYISRRIIGSIHEDSFWALFEQLIPQIQEQSHFKATNVVPIYFSHTKDDGSIDNIGCIVFH